MTSSLHVPAEYLLQLEHIAREYGRIEALMQQVAQGESLERFGDLSILYVDPSTLRIVETNSAALDFLGYSHEALIGMDIRALEVYRPEYSASHHTYIQNGSEEQLYTCDYRHVQGHTVTVTVHRRQMPRDGRTVFHYRLEDRSLAQRIRRELQRREDTSFKFQEKLKALNDIMLELTRIDSFDALCEQVIRLGMQRLGFDRLGMWFLDRENQMMIGSYGVDERGELRDEHEMRWSYRETYIQAFVDGKTDTTIAHDDEPIYNHHSEVIGYGWHVTAPIMHGSVCIGVLTADNYLRNYPIKSYEPELLRQYGLAVGQLTELLRRRQQAIALHLAEEQNKMLHTFLKDVGHDFRTPLSIISTKSFLIRRVESGEQKDAFAHDIQQQVMAISGMLNNMSEYIELIYGREMYREPTPLRNFVQSVIDGYRDQSQYAKVRWRVTLDRDATVMIDRQYMSQALGAIIENALQYTLDIGHVRINFLQAAHEIGIQIHDNGIGIHARDLPNIFKPLFRVDEARTERRSGLGLTLAKTVVEAHGGRITVESQVGQGSTFTVWLPDAE